MKSLALKTAIAGAAALAIATSLPAPAFAISWVQDRCTASNPLGHVYIENDLGTQQHCLKDPGFMSMAIYGVNYIDSGKYLVTIQFYRHVNSPVPDSMTLTPGGSWLGDAQDPIHAVVGVLIHQ